MKGHTNKDKLPYWISLPCLLIALVVIAISFFDMQSNDISDVTRGNSSAEKYDKLDVYFVDVGQGDSALIVSDSGKTMLIDAGEEESFTKLALLFDSLDIETLDAVVATHPHSDHIGGMTQVIDNYEITEFYMPECDSDTRTYMDMTEALTENNVHVNYVYGGNDKLIPWDDDVTVSVLSPIIGGEYNDINEQSIMLRIEYDGASVMFTGDCGEYAEQYALSRLNSTCFDSDVLKVGHHGSVTSSSYEFINAVSPSLAVISVGYNNKYGHPHKETLDLFDKIGCDVLRTDEAGTIHIALYNGRYNVIR